MGPLLILALLFCLWLFPIYMIITSNRTSSREKIAWVLAVIFISWFAWIFYILLAPIKRKE
ncbi:MAG: PLDc N-terminal domain-containing protein [Chitinophagaceae bacterium]|nr:PLDc N-terminal domain-containing protein [Chitinophagaceae bacterium]MBK7306579.1 PLDc N-terminal domain-containing protein [Chitinophagaceae bacterium]MBK8787730.1 PLDc N-terminal domain-containing protein [Chitinophagaceae bacterium]MBK9484941.1 PLDc N-terminal domain-containing protein [Chitinophagaceae bacterium]MBL0201723.1 PLDc N-terminal domain-containing protein [Chitinophagaceae bacterium]